MDDAMFQKTLAVRNDKEQFFFDIPGVFSLGIGLNSDAETGVGTYVLRVSVDQNYNGYSESMKAIPSEIDGVPVELQLSTPASLLSFHNPNSLPDKDKYRPLRGGIEINRKSQDDCGTMGCVVRGTDGQTIYGLSNAHVLGEANGIACQPKSNSKKKSCSDCCSQDDDDYDVGAIVKTVYNDYVDASIFKVDAGIGWKNEIVDVSGCIQGSLDIDHTHLNKEVFKRGRTTGLTKGIINAIHVTQKVGERYFHDQITIYRDPIEGHFCDGGDSGSVIMLSSSNQVIGLLIAGNYEGNTVANRISRVESEMGIMFMIGTNECDSIKKNPVHELRRINKALKTSEDPEVVLLNRLIYKHVNEVLRLIRNSRAVMLFWHRNQGPVMFKQFLEGGAPENSMVKYIDLMMTMGNILYEKGSPGLRMDLLRYKKLFIKRFEKLFTQGLV